METRKCSKCSKVKLLTEFGNNQSTNTGGDVYFRPECKECTSNINKGKTKAFKLAGKPVYPEVGTACDLCGKSPRAATKVNARPKKLVFDHGHVSLRHRGWLCDGCNRAMGMLGDDEVGMLKATLYTAKGEGRPPEVIKKVEELLSLFVELGIPDSNSLMEYYG
jgi:hypothetical protein